MKLNWGFGIAVVYIVFAGSMILFAVKASQQHYDLVSENYYADAVNYQQKIDAGNNAANSNSKLSIQYIAEKNAIEIIALGNSKDINGTLSFYKPDKARDDFQFAFSTGASGKQIIPMKKLAHGYWKINAAWNVDSKNCYIEKRIFIP